MSSYFPLKGTHLSGLDPVYSQPMTETDDYEPYEDEEAGNGEIETVRIDDLKSHPRNYRNHPPDQIEHLVASIKQNGFYKNIVIARDGTILAGHGAVEAAKKVGLVEVPARRLDVDPESSEAIRVLTGDNELLRFAEIDDRELTELLRQLAQEEEGLLGTGYDEMMLANLVKVTRFEQEIANVDAAAEWIGLPDYTPEEETLKVAVSFRCEDDRQRFLDEFGLREEVGFMPGRGPKVYSGWWPKQEEVRHDGGLRYSQGDDPEMEEFPEETPR